MLKPFSLQRDWFQRLEAKTPKTYVRKRFIFACLCILLTLLIVRLFTLHVTSNEFLRKQGNARTLRTVELSSYRGVISDRRGVPLAVSTPVDAVWINPKLFNTSVDQLERLSNLTNLTTDEILTKVNQYSQRSFVYLKRGLPPETASAIIALQIPGVGKKREFKRFYPSGKQVAQLVGFTDIDDSGQAGLELSFDNTLKPKIGKKRVLEDRMGHWIQDVDHFQAPQSGENIALSIDLRLQSIALRELESAVEKYKAKSATLVMIDIDTGEVLCNVSAPSFNPNNPKERTGEAVRNRAFTDQLEPGSTIKAISILSALSNHNYTPDTPIDTHPGIMRVGDHYVRDARNYGTLTVKDVLEKSSNVGISKIVLSFPSSELLHTFRSLGLGNEILTRFPGEQRGKLPPPPKNPFVQATLAFGYGLAVTPIQLAQAYAIIGAKGIKRPIRLIKQPEDQAVSPGERVLPAKTCDILIRMLTEVVADGTGKQAHIMGYSTAGKTGTVRVVGPQGYDPNRHIGLFAGISPVNNPKIATVVIVEEPDETKYYGGQTAAPIYKNVVSQALIMLNVPPELPAGIMVQDSHPHTGLKRKNA